MPDGSRLLRVLLVGPLPPPYGGIPSYVNDLYTKGIQGVKYSIFNTALPRRVNPVGRDAFGYDSFIENGIWAGLARLLYVATTVPALFMAILKQRPRIVHVFTCSYWGYWRSYLYLLTARLAGKKTVFHLLNAIDIFYERAGKLQRLLLRLSLSTEDLYLVQSPGLRDWLSRLTRRKVVGLWNGIDFSAIPPPTDADGNPSMTGPVGITVGSLGTSKGMVDILSAIVLLKAKGVHVSWVFVGAGDVARFREMAREAGVSESVAFTGAVSDAVKWGYLQHADFFCLPSYAEGQPISIIEAMGVGKTVIATAVGSIPELIEDGVTGRLIAPGDIGALAAAIESFVQDLSTVRAMGARARNTALSRHNLRDQLAAIGVQYSALAVGKVT